MNGSQASWEGANLQSSNLYGEAFREILQF